MNKETTLYTVRWTQVYQEWPELVELLDNAEASEIYNALMLRIMTK